jgi:methyltransferase (TIGR00027 family)
MTAGEPPQAVPGPFGSVSEPSRTSQTVALIRAGLARPHTPGGDSDAQRALCAGMTVVPAERWRDEVTERTRFFDGHLVAAISAGIRQVVTVGAGYDDRPLRFRAPGVRFFEIDHPFTQEDKVRRVRAMKADTDGLVFVPADLGVDDIAGLLVAHGHDGAEPSLFLCEGVLVYLDRPTIATLLGALRSRAGTGSTLAASLATHPAGIDSGLVADMANARRSTGVSEPWRTILPADEHLALLAEAGWRAEPSTDTARRDDHRSPRSLLVTART